MPNQINQPLTITPLQGIPDIKPGDDLALRLLEAIYQSGITIENGDILVVAQKIVSKAENRYFNYAELQPSHEALHLAELCDKDPQFIELVLMESKSVIRVAPGTLIVEHKTGFISANAGIDHSNIGRQSNQLEKWALLIPEDADASAKRIRKGIQSKTGKNVGVLIIDSHGRPWRFGTVGVSIGFSGVPALLDMRGQHDLYGRTLEATITSPADELAAAASLVMGEANEGVPSVHVRGFPYELSDSEFSELIRPKEKDLFR